MSVIISFNENDTITWMFVSLCVCLSLSVCLCVYGKDLTAVGITCPSARKRFKWEISRLDIDDGLPRSLPASSSSSQRPVYTHVLGQH